MSLNIFPLFIYFLGIVFNIALTDMNVECDKTSNKRKCLYNRLIEICDKKILKEETINYCLTC